MTYESWVNSFVENLSEYLNFQGWETVIEFATEESQDDGGETYAKISIDPVYQMATLTVYPVGKEDFDSGNLDKLRRRLLHEMTHFFFAPLMEFTKPHLSQVTCPYFMDILENQTQRLTMVLLKSLPDLNPTE